MKLILFLLFIFCFSVNSKSSTGCSACCQPSQSFRPLPLEFFLPVGIAIVIGYFLWCACFRDSYRSWRKKRIERSYSYKEKLPVQGSLHYKIQTHSTAWNGYDWNSKPQHTLIFNENQIAIEEFDRPETRREGSIEKNGLITIPANGDLPSLKLYTTKLPGSSQAGFVGFRKKEFDEDLWIMLPNEFDREPGSLFPYMQNVFLMLYFGLILLMSCLCLVTWWKMHSNGFYGDFFLGAVGTPWGALCSFLGLVVMFFLLNPFGFVFVKINDGSCAKVINVFFFMVCAVCLSFSVIDMITANFMTGESMIDTRDHYVLDRDEIASFCKLDQYDCSVYWSANLTKRTDDCRDAFYYLCISFDASQGSCQEGNNAVFNLFLTQSLFQFFVALLWFCAYILISDMCDSDLWLPILGKLADWNEKPYITEKKQEVEIIFKEDSRLLGDKNSG